MKGVLSQINNPYPNGIVSLKVEADILKRKADSALVNELKAQWSLLWKESFNDGVKAESISITDYIALYVEKGTVIQATRDFKILDFKEILEQHRIEKPERFLPVDNSVGGWNKFIKTKITNTNNTRKSLREKRVTAYVPVKPSGKQLKKGGRGWLHNI
jgi:hypothetical protein